jgi:hypothetical protein
MNSPSLSMERFKQAPTTDAPHELSEAVNLIEAAIRFTATYDRGYWLKQVSACRFDHPVDEITRLLKTMRDRREWLLKEKREVMNCGGWLTNRLKEARPTISRRATLEPTPPAT